MLNGVTFINPETCTISEDCEIGMDVLIESNSHIRGKSVISSNCIIGPNTFIQDTNIKSDCKIINSTIFNSKIMSNITIGPFSHIRPGSKISSNASDDLVVQDTSDNPKRLITSEVQIGADDNDKIIIKRNS